VRKNLEEGRDEKKSKSKADTGRTTHREYQEQERGGERRSSDQKPRK